MRANQYIADPRQIKFLEWYLDPKSDTFSNVKQSALRVGYSETYAENLSGQLPDWLSEKLGELQMLSKAERNLNHFLDFTKDPKIQADITKFVAERLGKSKYSQRNENININIPVPLLNVLRDNNSNTENSETQE